MELGQLLPDKDFDLKMRFEKADIAAFYGPGPDNGAVVAERQKWISEDPATYLALSTEGVSLLDETIEMAMALETLPQTDTANAFTDLDPMERCRLLGERWESDFLLMKPDSEGVFRMVGGGLCFPSHWDLNDKMGKPMTAIHGPVPGLNDALGKQIDGFLHRIKPGISWERFNWGLSRTPELNLHPSRDLPRLDSTVDLEDVWWRLEEQSLVALPNTGGILFGIKLVIKPLSEIKDHPAARAGMVRALETMEEPMAKYKGIATARERLIELLR